MLRLRYKKFTTARSNLPLVSMSSTWFFEVIYDRDTEKKVLLDTHLLDMGFSLIQGLVVILHVHPFNVRIGCGSFRKDCRILL